MPPPQGSRSSPVFGLCRPPMAAAGVPDRPPFRSPLDLAVLPAAAPGAPHRLLGTSVPDAALVAVPFTTTATTYGPAPFPFDNLGASPSVDGGEFTALATPAVRCSPLVEDKEKKKKMR